MVVREDPGKGLNRGRAEGLSTWAIDTPWFDVAVVMSVFGVGNILFGRFEEHKSRARRIAKVVLVLAAVVLLSRLGLRSIAYGLIGVLGLAALWVHAWWLPKHGINGWTGEPREKYLALVSKKGLALPRTHD